MTQDQGLDLPSNPPSSHYDNHTLDTENPTEIARLINQDRLFSRITGELFSEQANQDFTNIHYILDIGCGPGAWVLNVAHKYPHIEVIGIDSNEKVVKYAQANARSQGLKNAFFEIMDATQPLDFPQNVFDIINIRAIVGFIHTSVWPQLLQECMRIMRPGGIIRLTESDWGSSNSPACEKLIGILMRALSQTGLCFSTNGHASGITVRLTDFLHEAGCCEVQKKVYLVDFSTGSQEYADIYQNCMVALRLLRPFLIATQQISEQDFEPLYQQALAEMLSDNFCNISYIVTAWGKKPLSDV